MANISRREYNSEDSPRTSKENIEALAKAYGRDSNVYRVRVLGEFPIQEDDVYIPLPIIEAGINTERDTTGNITFGVDVARFGDDKTVISTKVGNTVELPVIRQGQNLMRTVGDIVQLYRQTLKDYPKYKGRITVNIDDTGLGGGVTDRLQEVVVEQKLSRMTVVAVNFGGKIDNPDAADNFANMGTYLWSFLRHELQEGRLALPNNTEMVAQLSVRKYEITSAGKIILESKEAMKKRGVHSPDIGDAIALACYTPKGFSLDGLIR